MVQVADSNGLPRGKPKDLDKIIYCHFIIFKILLSFEASADVTPLKTNLFSEVKPIKVHLFNYLQERQDFLSDFVQNWSSAELLISKLRSIEPVFLFLYQNLVLQNFNLLLTSAQSTDIGSNISVLCPTLHVSWQNLLRQCLSQLLITAKATSSCP